MRRLLVLVLLPALLDGSAQADNYWIAWEGAGATNGLPEEVGPWTRNWGNWDGQYEGPGAYRTVENGILTYDSLYDPGVADFSFIERPGHIDPEPGSAFMMQWRLKVDEVTGSWPYDPSLSIESDEAMGVGFAFGVDRMQSVWENLLTIPLTPGVYHDYYFESVDMLTYELFVDGQLLRAGQFAPIARSSYVGWGDGVQGAASLHHWDYFRVGTSVVPSGPLLPYRPGPHVSYAVVPEPGPMLVVCGLMVACRVRRQ